MPPPAIAFKLPAFLRECGSCMVLENANPAVLDWVRVHEGSVVGSHGAAPNAIWVEVAVDLWDDQRVHFHIERYPSDLSGERSIHCDFDTVVKKITDFIALLEDRPLCVRTKGRLTVANADLPESGLIARLLRTSASACGVPASLTGGFLDIDNDLFTKIYFKQTAKRDAVNIEIDFQTKDVFGLDFLGKADEILRIGADCFIYERITSEASNVS